jgi:hypothetical protein
MALARPLSTIEGVAMRISRQTTARPGPAWRTGPLATLLAIVITTGAMSLLAFIFDLIIRAL